LSKPHDPGNEQLVNSSMTQGVAEIVMQHGGGSGVAFAFNTGIVELVALRTKGKKNRYMAY
jgi:hypothetical protein